MGLTMRIATLSLAAALSAAWSCGSDSGVKASSEGGGGPSTATPAKARPAPVAVGTANLPDACDLVPKTEIERIVGLVVGLLEHKEKGCLAPFPIDSSTPDWTRRRQLEASGADSRYLDLYFPRPSLFVEVNLTGPALTNPEGAPAAPDGWDAVGSRRPIRSRFTGRTGHITITVEKRARGIPGDTLLAMADRVRHRIPDLPFAHPLAGRPGNNPTGRDPCAAFSPAPRRSRCWGSSPWTRTEATRGLPWPIRRERAAPTSRRGIGS